MFEKITIIFITLLAMSTLGQALSVSVEDYNPKPGETGDYLDIWLKIENPALEAAEGEFYIEIFPRDGLELSNGEDAKKRIGLMPPLATHTIEYRLLVKKDAVQGPNLIDVKLTNENAVIEKTISVTVEDDDELEVNFQIGDLESDPDRIKPDDENVELRVTLLNLGDANAKGTKTVLKDVPVGFSFTKSYSDEYLVGNVDSDSSAVAKFHIDVNKNVSPGDYSAILELSYKYEPDEDEDDYLFETIDLPLEISVRSVPIYEITNVSVEPLTAGEEDVKVQITIQNLGEEEGESVRIKAFAKTEQPFSFDDSSDFVAPILRPGEYGQGTIQFDVDKDANLQKYLIDLEIKSIVNDDVITSRHTVPVEVMFERSTNPWRFALIGIILLAAYFGYRYFFKKK
ncbi:hypothetical protein BVX95_01655 [archaeon D22]|nr:hypothetical protein BVX95_01655 [archaeon D22]